MAAGQEDGSRRAPRPAELNDEIVIELADLVEEYPSPTRSVRSDDVFVITANDLAAIDDETAFPPVGVGTGWGAAHSGNVSYGPARPGIKKSGIGRTALAPVWQGLLFGAAGGFLAWALQELFFNDEGSTSTTQGEVIAEVAVWAAVIGLILGAVLGSAEGVTSRVSRKAWIGAAWGAGLGFVGGLIGGAIAQAVYGAAQHSGVESTGAQIAIRALGWAIFGLGVGVAQGAAQRKWRKAVNGLIGGAVGGLVGGALFDPIALAIGGGAISRMVAITVLGAAMGAAIGVVEEVRKQAWLQVISGLLTGKQFILYSERTTIGSSPKCDIVLPKDPAVAPIHAVITRNQSGCILAPSAPGLRLDSSPVERPTRLRSGQHIGVGSSWLLFTEKRESPVGVGGVGRIR